MKLHYFSFLSHAVVGAALIAVAIYTPIPPAVLIAMEVVFIGTTSKILSRDDDDLLTAFALGAGVMATYFAPRLLAQIEAAGSGDNPMPWDRALKEMAPLLVNAWWGFACVALAIVIWKHYLIVKRLIRWGQTGAVK